MDTVILDTLRRAYDRQYRSHPMPRAVALSPTNPVAIAQAQAQAQAQARATPQRTPGSQSACAPSPASTASGNSTMTAYSAYSEQRGMRDTDVASPMSTQEEALSPHSRSASSSASVSSASAAANVPSTAAATSSSFRRHHDEEYDDDEVDEYEFPASDLDATLASAGPCAGPAARRPDAASAAASAAAPTGRFSRGSPDSACMADISSSADPWRTARIRLDSSVSLSDVDGDAEESSSWGRGTQPRPGTGHSDSSATRSFYSESSSNMSMLSDMQLREACGPSSSFAHVSISVNVARTGTRHGPSSVVPAPAAAAAVPMDASYLVL